MDSLTTGSANITYLVLNGNVVRPACWCGDPHDGDYGAYGYAQHHCEHPEFMTLHETTILCVSCGMVSQLSAGA